MKIRRGHAKDRIRQAVDPNGFADDGGIAPKSRLPRAVAQHGIRAVSGMHVIILMEEAAQCGLDAEDIEIIAGGKIAPNALRAAIGL